MVAELEPAPHPPGATARPPASARRTPRPRATAPTSGSPTASPTGVRRRLRPVQRRSPRRCASTARRRARSSSRAGPARRGRRSAHRILEAAASEASAALVRVYSLREAEARASTDALTGLPNRRYFDEYLGAARQAPPRRGPGRRADDRHRPVQEAQRHVRARRGRPRPARGRRGRSPTAVREDDVPARFGGEEFAVLLRNPSPEIAVEVGERVRRPSRRSTCAGSASRASASRSAWPSPSRPTSRSTSSSTRPTRPSTGPSARAATGSSPRRHGGTPYPWVMPRRVVQTDLPAQPDEAVPDAASTSRRLTPTRRRDGRRRAAAADQRGPRPDLPRDRRHPRGQGRARVQDRRLPPRRRRDRAGAVRRRRAPTPRATGARSPASARRSATRSSSSRRPATWRAYEQPPRGVPGQPRRPAADPGRRAARPCASSTRASASRSLEDLRQAAEAGTLRGLKGISASTEQRILEGIEQLESPPAGASCSTGPRRIVDDLVAAARRHARRRADRAGGLASAGARRPIGDLDLLVETDDPDGVVERFTAPRRRSTRSSVRGRTRQRSRLAAAGRRST